MLAAERQAELTAEIGRILDAESPHDVFEVGAAVGVAACVKLRNGSSNWWAVHCVRCAAAPDRQNSIASAS